MSLFKFSRLPDFLEFPRISPASLSFLCFLEPAERLRRARFFSSFLEISRAPGCFEFSFVFGSILKFTRLFIVCVFFSSFPHVLEAARPSGSKASEGSAADSTNVAEFT